MSKLRVLVRRGQLPEVLRALQDFGLLHLAAEPDPSLEFIALTPRQLRLRRQTHRILDDIAAVDAALAQWTAPAVAATAAVTGAARASNGLPAAARAAWRVRRDAERLADRRRSLFDERTQIAKYRELFAAFREPLARMARAPGLTTLALVVPRREVQAVDALGAALRTRLGAEFAITTHPLADGDTAVLLAMPAALAARAEPLLAEARLTEVRVPEAYAGLSLADAVPRMLDRLDAVERELAEVDGAAVRAAAARSALRDAERRAHDCLAELDAMAQCGATAHAAAIEGWVPTTAVNDLLRRLEARFGGMVEVQTLAREQWSAERAPVVLSNPRLFRPFEAVVRLMPLPSYGSIDPTPFVGVFFPMMVGMIIGDIGYGALLAILGLVMRRRARGRTVLRDVGDIATACALFAVIFGALYGELFGSLGRGWLGLHALLDREEAMVAMLAIAIGLGLVHVLLGLILGTIGSWRHERRRAVGRGVTALMVLLVVVALLASFEILPRAFFTPAVIATLVAFPVLVIAEGIIAPVELMSTFGNILSYARIMALGTASVMMAVTANRLAGTMGSTAVGIAFALIFHLVNFGIALFSPTLHVLRLHYVEFFQKFYSPGGQRYRPFAHWSAAAGG